MGISSEKQSVHQDVISVLKENKRQNVSKIGRSLDNLFDTRKDADYQISYSFDIHNSKNAISLAKYILKEFDKLSPSDYF